MNWILILKVLPKYSNYRWRTWVKKLLHQPVRMIWEVRGWRRQWVGQFCTPGSAPINRPFTIETPYNLIILTCILGNHLSSFLPSIYPLPLLIFIWFLNNKIKMRRKWNRIDKDQLFSTALVVILSSLSSFLMSRNSTLSGRGTLAHW